MAECGCKGIRKGGCSVVCDMSRESGSLICLSKSTDGSGALCDDWSILCPSIDSS